MTIEERLSRIEEQLSAIITALGCPRPGQAGTSALLPFDGAKYRSAIRRAKRGDYGALQEYLGQYEGPKPQ